MTPHYDSVVVGGRCAGAATGMLLARAGLHVLVLEASRPGTDTLSTHALMRGGVLQLHRWGLLDAVAAAGTPPVRSTEFHYGHEMETVELRPGSAPLRAPRRTVLDPILQDAARGAGAELRHGVRVTRVLNDAEGCVTGVEILDRGSRTMSQVTAGIVIGADGRHSLVADAVEAPFEHRGRSSSAFLYTYWSGFDLDRYQWFYRPGATAGIIPTNGGQVCLWTGTPSVRFHTELRGDLDASYRTLLGEAAPELTPALAHGRRDGPVRGYPGVPGHLRRASGPGWALVGDAGYFKDPITAHGITDALRDAELLANAVTATPGGGTSRRDALRDYQRTRDGLSKPLFALTERLASYQWDLAELRELLPALSRAMRPEIDALHDLDQVITTAA
jgi:2-polyprenyl-6-methoxyphenol hydroxylase-like FAD-dependent oxidoreductase